MEILNFHPCIHHRDTVDLCQQVEAAGVSWISVHGRTKDQRKEPVNLEAVKLIRENVGIPVIANGDIKSLTDTKMVQDSTGVKGQSFLLHLLFVSQHIKVLLNFCMSACLSDLQSVLAWAKLKVQLMFHQYFLAVQHGQLKLWLHKYRYYCYISVQNMTLTTHLEVK